MGKNLNSHSWKDMHKKKSDTSLWKARAMYSFEENEDLTILTPELHPQYFNA